MLGYVNKFFILKSLLTTFSNVLPVHLKQTFLPIIWIFTQGEEHEIESNLVLKSFLLYLLICCKLLYLGSQFVNGFCLSDELRAYCCNIYTVIHHLLPVFALRNWIQVCVKVLKCPPSKCRKTYMSGQECIYLPE